MPADRPFRVLSIDGGGMRGLYTAAFLDCLVQGFARQRGVRDLDVGKGFDLIVGTSTGAILGAGLAIGIEPRRIADLYAEHGPEIFPLKLPRAIGLELLHQFLVRRKAMRAGAVALERALERELGGATLGQVYRDRGIALAVTAVDLSDYRSWVFKTPHGPGSNGRDDGYRLVDVCLASSAAPIYRSLAAVDSPRDPASFHVFADGGLWANNPVLVGLIDALALAGERPIEVFCLGNPARPEGRDLGRTEVDRGIAGWKFGADIAPLSIAAQEYAFDNMARLLAGHLRTPCTVTRFPVNRIPASMLEHLDLDATGLAACTALRRQAAKDADLTNSLCNDPADAVGGRIRRLFLDLPAR